MNWDKIFLDVACSLKSGSKCVKLQVGCIIVKNNRIVSSGVNGTPSGFKNCCDQFPDGINTEIDIEKHYIWSKLHETHAEMNAILSAAQMGININNSKMYITTFPCSECLKNMIQLGIKNIFFKDYYSFGDVDWSLEYANKNNVKFFKLSKSETTNIDLIFKKLNFENYKNL